MVKSLGVFLLSSDATRHVGGMVTLKVRGKFRRFSACF